MNKKVEKIIILIIFLFIFSLAIYFLNIKNYNNDKYIEIKSQNRFLSENIDQNISIDNNIETYKRYDFENKKFAIISRKDCDVCGLFSFYSLHLGCILIYLSQGYIPIIKTEVNSVFYSEEMKGINKNLWEELFNQPFNYTLEEVIKNAKHIENKSCTWTNMAPAEGHVYSNELTLKFYREASRKYMSIKNEILEEANIIWNKLFNNTKNVLGVLARGTDFLDLKPGGHSIPPSVEKIIEDTKMMYEKNKYDWIYLATEDDSIREKFIKEFGNKLKLFQNKTINYKGGFIGENKNVIGIEFQKIYLISMIIISKCLDVIITRCSGAMGAFIFSKGFRENIVYFLGQY
jgi:hypothetical protein